MKSTDQFPSQGAFLTGTPIGYRACAGVRQAICIPLDLRRRPCHVIGRPGTGKSRLLEGMILDDVARGAGVAVLDPSGDLVERLLTLVPARDANRVIYFRPGRREWVPLWNPLESSRETGPGAVADALVPSLMGFASGWRDREEFTLWQSFRGASYLPHPTLRDVWQLLHTESAESKRLRRATLARVDNEQVRHFWQEDFRRFGGDVRPARDLLGRLLVPESSGLMLSQPENAFDLRQIMDTERVVLIDLSALEPQARGILGCLVFTLIERGRRARSAVLADRRDFHVYCDEAQCYLPPQLNYLEASSRAQCLAGPIPKPATTGDAPRSAGCSGVGNLQHGRIVCSSFGQG